MGSGPAILGVAVPIIAIIFGVSAAMFGAYLKYRRDTEALKLTHAERLAAIEKGMELPPSPYPLIPFQESREALRVRVRNLRTAGLILLAVGLTVALANEGYGLLFGMVPGSVGIALLIASILDSREERDARRPTQGPQPPEL